MEYDIDTVPIRPMIQWWSYLFPANISLGIYPFGIFLGRWACDVEDPRKDPRTRRTILHELAHLRQQCKWYQKAWWFGLVAWYFCYLCILPVFFNKFRWNWEWEAFRTGQNYDEHYVEELLGRKWYGWLKAKWHK